MREVVAERAMAFVEDLMSSPARTDVLAVIVSGSAAREEERWVDGELRSDIDMMVISRSSRLRIDKTRAVGRVFSRHLDSNVEGGRIPVSTLDYATLANYEARHGGVVVHGDAAVLRKIPMEDPSQIPSWEAVRLVANRFFEHLKLQAGMTGEEAAALKSYEAIGESQLVLEGRYQPSFRERVAEIERAPLGSPVVEAGARYVAAEEVRSGKRAGLEVSAALALEDLKLQLAATLSAQGLPGETFDQQFSALEQREFHFAQRVYWTVRGLSHADGKHRLTTDPILQVWRAGIRGLSGKTTDYDSRALVSLWQQCPQIFKKVVSS